MKENLCFLLLPQMCCRIKISKHFYLNMKPDIKRLSSASKRWEIVGMDNDRILILKAIGSFIGAKISGKL